MELDSIRSALHRLQARTRTVEEELGAAASTGETFTGIGSKIAALHGEARQLLESRVDAVLTGSLTAGREKARYHKKELAKQLGALIDQLEQLHRQLGGAQLAPDPRPKLSVVRADPCRTV